jgi:hypothetical protein
VELTNFNIAAIAVGAFGVGFFKSTLSMGVGLVLVPLMIIIWPTRFVMGLIAVHMFLSDYAIIRMFWKEWEWNLARLVIPGFYIGIVMGAYLLVQLPDYWVRKAIGIGCLTFVLYQAWSEWRGGAPAPKIGRGAGFGIGVVGGTVSALTHSGGIVLSLYLISQGVRKVPLVATILITWLFVNPVKLTSYFVGGLANWPILGVALAMIPLTFAGGWIGRRLLDRFSQKGFNMTLLVLAAASAARLLWE